MDLTYNHAKFACGLSKQKLASGLQKSIRHGRVADMRWGCQRICEVLAVEQRRSAALVPADADKAVLEAKKVVSNLLHRLLVTYLEDTHAGEPMLWPWVEERVKLLIALRANPNRCADFAAVLDLTGVVLCMGRHSRLYSLVRRAANPPLPTDVAPPADQPLALELLPLKFAPLLDHLNADDPKEPPLVAGIDLPWWRKQLPPKERWLPNAAASIHQALLSSTADAEAAEMQKLLGLARAVCAQPLPAETQLVVPPFFESEAVVDLHTPEGKRHPDGKLRFALLGSLVVRDRPLLPPAFHALYVAGKLEAPLFQDIDALLLAHPFAARLLRRGGQSESLMFQEFVRAQLTCSGSRPDTGLA
ncbi:Hypothetical protein UVM_LOCUS87 [uncultured virus]|nr:Hypothetical protein UVM_LOCUS87 [uncultured virus]